MAKVLHNIQVFIKGNDTQPTSIEAIYQLRDQDDASLVTRPKNREVELSEAGKVLYDEGAVGEFWKDLTNAIKSAEGI